MTKESEELEKELERLSKKSRMGLLWENFWLRLRVAWYQRNASEEEKEMARKVAGQHKREVIEKLRSLSKK